MKPPKFCQYCGTRLVLEKSESWVETFTCNNCPTKCTVTYGDMMGGSDHCYVNWSEVKTKPFRLG